MVCTFWLWLKALDTGSMLWSAACAVSYFYMVAAWGGYVFIWNIIAVHAFVLGALCAWLRRCAVSDTWCPSAVICGRYSHRLYVSYCTWFVLGLLMSMQGLCVAVHCSGLSSHTFQLCS